MKNHSSPEPAAHATLLSDFHARTSATPAPDILQQKCCDEAPDPQKEMQNLERVSLAGLSSVLRIAPAVQVQL